MAILYWCVVFSLVQLCLSADYYVGTAIADVTGPAVELNMMGYAVPEQISSGIHLRQYSRAFIFATSPSSARFVFATVDIAWGGGLMKQEVIKKLKKTHGNLYTEKNVCISGTHTHGAAGAYSQYVLFDVTSLGFSPQSFDAIVDGIVKSINDAHASMRPADIFLNSGELLDASINRSPTAYLENPQAERDNYTHDVDKTMTLLQIVDENGNDMGMINWFAVHCTSMRNSNKLLTSDNKGYASILFEQQFNPDSLPGQGPFVAAFAQSNEGDVSPNTKGASCVGSGNPCDAETSTCSNGEVCEAFGPGADMFESTKIIAEKQYQKALDLYNTATRKLTGPVDFRHTYVDMTNQVVTLDDGTQGRSCKPAMGYSFAAGTTDGPGASVFQQGTTTSNPFWNFVAGLIVKPSDDSKECHKPKPILISTGEISQPHLWQPEIVDVQLLRVGDFVIVPVPGEFTTMAGRRLRESVRNVLVAEGYPASTETVIAGLSNEYADYVTTFEEYQVQRYEGGSTIYGPHTLAVYQKVFSELAVQMAQNQASPAGPSPPNLLDEQFSFLTPVVFDSPPIFKDFGSVLKNAKSSYDRGSQVQVKFVSANPRNDLKTGQTYLTVEKKAADGSWEVKFTDASWETKYKWERTNTILGQSEVKIEWDIPANQEKGEYRIRHFGTSRSLSGKTSDFVGKSKTFKVK